MSDVVSNCGARHAIRAKHVIAHRLPGIDLLHQRHMLIGRSMKYDVRTVAAQNLVEQQRILSISNDRYDRHFWEFVAKLFIEPVDSELRDVKCD